MWCVHCAYVMVTAVRIIFPVILQTDINLRMLSIERQEWKNWYTSNFIFATKTFNGCRLLLLVNLYILPKMHSNGGKAVCSTCQVACVHCVEPPRWQQAVAERALHSSTCVHTGRMPPGHECTTPADLSPDPMQTPHVAEVAPQAGVGYISSCHPLHVSCHAARDRGLSDSTDLLCCHLCITAMHPSRF